MQVKARAVIVIAGRVVIAEARRAGQRTLTLPGGRPARGETLQGTLAREVREEVGLQVTSGPLLYVAEVVSGSTMQELNVLFAASPLDASATAPLTLGPGDADGAQVMPPILDAIFADLQDGWPPPPRFLGNIHVPGRRAT